MREHEQLSSSSLLLLFVVVIAVTFVVIAVAFAAASGIMIDVDGDMSEETTSRNDPLALTKHKKKPWSLYLCITTRFYRRTKPPTHLSLTSLGRF